MKAATGRVEIGLEDVQGQPLGAVGFNIVKGAHGEPMIDFSSEEQLYDWYDDRGPY